MSDDPLYFELCEEVNTFLRRTGRGKGFAPPLFWFKVCADLCVARNQSLRCYNGRETPREVENKWD